MSQLIPKIQQYTDAHRQGVEHFQTYLSGSIENGTKQYLISLTNSTRLITDFAVDATTPDTVTPFETVKKHWANTKQLIPPATLPDVTLKALVAYQDNADALLQIEQDIMTFKTNTTLVLTPTSPAMTNA